MKIKGDILRKKGEKGTDLFFNFSNSGTEFWGINRVRVNFVKDRRYSPPFLYAGPHFTK